MTKATKHDQFADEIIAATDRGEALMVPPGIQWQRLREKLQERGRHLTRSFAHGGQGEPVWLAMKGHQK